MLHEIVFVIKVQQSGKIFIKFDWNLMLLQVKTEFVIYKGEIKFQDNKIIIRDDILKWHRFLAVAYPVVYIIFGAYMVIRNLVTHQNWTLLLGLAIIAIGVIALILNSKVSLDNELDVSKVNRAVISKDFASYLNLRLYLKDSRKRKVQLDYRDEDRFEKLYLNELIETLKSFSIDTEVKLA